MIGCHEVAPTLRYVLLAAIARFGWRFVLCALWRGVLGQNLESIVSLGRWLIGFDLTGVIDLLTFAILGLLARNRFRQVLGRQPYLVWYGIRHDHQLLQRLFDLLGVIRCHIGSLCRRWNNRDCV